MAIELRRLLDYLVDVIDAKCSVNLRFRLAYQVHGGDISLSFQDIPRHSLNPNKPGHKLPETLGKRIYRRKPP